MDIESWLRSHAHVAIGWSTLDVQIGLARGALIQFMQQSCGDKDCACTEKHAQVRAFLLEAARAMLEGWETEKSVWQSLIDDLTEEETTEGTRSSVRN